ncbi:bacillithiol biosynthesis cysteine-adding enzyme BshC [Metasolibacillus meyeri]|uniref:Putative cysteine ligase BshC n=1 Tax=Metasolibacillus meyeri TaxID=1071052 RepID=A0AAW9NVI0_9BACL|nr:bacillithiol biosynthesis cysteine-adding enzyme BshC [Metasolibacillus meyeri]MEC1179454.1 bacillithiol biosynthesis cysteine-adding enzyme BshC [Metasolibacillus meyeri]
MKLEQNVLPVQNKIMAQYWSKQSTIHDFFDYAYSDDAFQARAQYLATKTYDTAQLSNIIQLYMAPFGVSEASQQHLEELAAGAYVIVGGQQAGLLTGPLYSVHKAISVILLAKQQRAKLGKPVVPLFWIAGEDHDIEEINHTYTTVDATLKKRVYKERSKRKTMASTTVINKEEMEQFVRTVFADFGETAYTKDLLHNVLTHLQGSKTFTDFFTALMNELFAKHGLLMLDAAFPTFRQYEANFFVRLIEHNEEIAQVVVAQEEAFEQAGYGKPIEATVSNANLFFVQDGERFLLERKEEYYTNTLGHIKLTKEQLLEIAQQTPEKLSNNVVTRPLMQEMTIPVLSFVGGPGELAYWATLKPAFSLLQLQMPIFAPRLNMTLVSRMVQPLLAQHDLTIFDVMEGQVEQLKNRFIEEVQDEQAKENIAQMQQQLLAQYEELEQYLRSEQLDLRNIIQKNKQYHRMQFDYLASKIEQEILRKHDVKIKQFDLLLTELFPNNNLQERLFNPYQYLNIYGFTLIDGLIELNLVPSFQHNYVIL